MSTAAASNSIGTEQQPSKDHMRRWKLAERYLRESGHTPDTPRLHYWQGEFWFWDEERCCWGRRDRETAALRLLAWLGSNGLHSSIAFARDVLDILAAQTVLYCEQPPAWRPAASGSLGQHWIVCRNVMLNPDKYLRGEAGAVRDISSRYFTRNVLPLNFAAGAGCPLWEAAVLSWCEDDPERVRLLQEFVGYWLTPGTEQHAFLVLLGPPGTGKSTFLLTVSMLLGQQNCTWLPLVELGSPFSLTELDGRLLNVCDEAKTIPKRAGPVLTSWASGAPVTVNRKYLPYATILPTARIAIATNAWLEFENVSEGVWRRTFIVPFRRQVVYDDTAVNFEHRFGPELPGILNWALEGRRRLLQQQRFSSCAAAEREKAAYQSNEGNPREWAAECLQKQPAAFVSNTALLQSHKRWSQLNSTTAAGNLHHLKQAISELFQSATLTHRQAGCRGVLGIALKPPALGD